MKKKLHDKLFEMIKLQLRLRQRRTGYDEETGEKAYKPVVRLSRNTTKEWYHIRVNGEEIVCMGGHPFYVLNIA